MRLELTGRHVDVTPSLRRLVDAKLARLDRLLKDTALSAQVVLAREKFGTRVDVTLHARGEKFLHAAGKGDGWAASMAQAVERLVQQAQTVKGKWQARKRQAGRAAALEEAPPTPRAPKETEPSVRARMPRILRTLRRAIKPMSLSEAARQLEGDGGVVIFRDVETATLAILYRGQGGELTLVETEP